MVCRRRCLRLRSRSSFALVIIGVVCLGGLLIYHSLNGVVVSSHDGSSPSRERKKLLRYQAANLKDTPNEIKKKFNFGIPSVLPTGGTAQNLGKWDIQDILSLLYPSDWKSAIDPDEAAIILNDKLLELDLQSPLSCHDIDDYQIIGNIGSNSKKFVEHLQKTEVFGSFNSYNQNYQKREEKQMVLKSQGKDLQTKIACMKKVYDADFCGPMGNYILMRELFLFSFLRHPGLVNILGYCLRGDHISMDIRKKGLMLVMESGVPLTPSMVTSLPWPHRIEIALNVSLLMDFFDTSPLGSLGLPHLQLKDFVLVDKFWVKLVDLDDVVMEEKTCSWSSDCLLQGSDIGTECSHGRCKGLNMKINMKVVGVSILEPLLRDCPAEEKDRMLEMLGQVTQLDVSFQELVVFLQDLAKKYETVDTKEDAIGEDNIQDRVKSNLDQKGKRDDTDNIHDNNEDVISRDRDFQKVDKTEFLEEMAQNPQPKMYGRLNSSNFPGMFDYTCTNSRVTWGCVMTADSLSNAMIYCTADPICKAFVVFSSQPELDKKMTVIFKNQTSNSPHTNLGTTIFYKKLTGKAEVDSFVASNRLDKASKYSMEKAVKGDKVFIGGVGKSRDNRECLERSLGVLQDALNTREKRLMAHMGLKGLHEQEWRYAVQVQKVANFSSLHALTNVGSRGGTMIIGFNATSSVLRITRAKFMAEDGPKQCHAAFSLLYHMDRLLGLYHTPPAVESHISPQLVQMFHKNSTWKAIFGSLVDSDSFLRGLFVAPTPKVMKKFVISLSPLPNMVSSVIPFNRTQKMQLEYILLWWLGHMPKPGNLHRGFKGHLIHVDADQAFHNPAVNVRNYFNHCQFPNVVFKILSCFRCHGSQISRVCSLGQEVARRVEQSGLNLTSSYYLHENDYVGIINRAASSVVEMVDTCIHEFGREAVLY